jgi:hypothetical protein
MSFIITSQQKSTNLSFFSIYLYFYLINRCQEFLNYIDTHFLIDEKSPSRLELTTRAITIDNQFNEYIQTINQEITKVKYLN